MSGQGIGDGAGRGRGERPSTSTEFSDPDIIDLKHIDKCDVASTMLPMLGLVEKKMPGVRVVVALKLSPTRWCVLVSCVSLLCFSCASTTIIMILSICSPGRLS